MSDVTNRPTDHTDDEFERIGRAAGAELRVPPPDGGPSAAHGAARRRGVATRVATAAGVLAVGAFAAIGVGVLVDTSDDDAPVGTVPPTAATPSTGPVPTATTEPATAPTNATRSTDAPASGTWRDIDTAAFVPRHVAVAAWTGHEAVILGADDLVDGSLRAVAHDLAAGSWRRLAEPPASVTRADNLPPGAMRARWTGSEVIVATITGDVVTYDPDADVWQIRSAAPDVTGAMAGDVMFAVSSDGVLRRTAEHEWLWYDAQLDEWASITSDPLPGDTTAVVDLADGDLAAVRFAESEVSWSVFDAGTRTWGEPGAVDAPPITRGVSECHGASGRIVCFAEGYFVSEGVVVDPVAATTRTFSLGNHSSDISVSDIPWFSHASRILSPASAEWEVLPSRAGSDTFGAAVWTGSELVFFGGDALVPGTATGETAAYTPINPP